MQPLVYSEVRCNSQACLLGWQDMSDDLLILSPLQGHLSFCGLPVAGLIVVCTLPNKLQHGLLPHRPQHPLACMVQNPCMTKFLECRAQ